MTLPTFPSTNSTADMNMNMNSDMNTSSIPKFMKAAQASDYCSGNATGSGEDNKDDVLTVANQVATPSLTMDEYDPTEPIHPLMQYATRKDRATHMIIRTLAVGLAPGDARVLSGQTREFQGPPSLPYIPGGDCCGVVVETSSAKDGDNDNDNDNDNSYFQVGDLVAARFTVAPRDAMAEYARVSTTVCEKVPVGIDPVDAAALASASPAVCLSDYIRSGERVLVLGAGGGIGSHFVQLARHYRNASFICGVSQSPERLLQAPLHYDDAIDYTKENVWESSKYQEEPFDTIIDLASGGWPQMVDHVVQNQKPSIVKPASQGGRFITFTPDKPTFDGHSLGAMLSVFLVQPMWRALTSRIIWWRRSQLPTFTQAMGLPDNRDIMRRTLDLAKQGKLKAVIDGPYPLTTEGVRHAFSKLQSRHAHGKVVVQVSTTNE